MRYTITIERHDQDKEGNDRVHSVYLQSFDELNVPEMITRLNHVPVKRPRKAKAAK